MSQVSGRMSKAGKSSFGLEQLEVYHLAMPLITEVYNLSQAFPAEQRFGLIGQIRRTANSVAFNIAEGKGLDKDFLRFFYQARGALLKTVSALQTAENRGFTSAQQTASLCAKSRELMGKLNSLTAYMKQSVT